MQTGVNFNLLLAGIFNKNCRKVNVVNFSYPAPTKVYSSAFAESYFHSAG